MMAEFLKELVEDREVRQQFSFTQITPRPILTAQSKEKLEKYFEESQALKCSFFKDLDDRKIDESEILFLAGKDILRKQKRNKKKIFS